MSRMRATPPPSDKARNVVRQAASPCVPHRPLGCLPPGQNGGSGPVAAVAQAPVVWALHLLWHVGSIYISLARGCCTGTRRCPAPGRLRKAGLDQVATRRATLPQLQLQPFPRSVPRHWACPPSLPPSLLAFLPSFLPFPLPFPRLLPPLPSPFPPSPTSPSLSLSPAIPLPFTLSKTGSKHKKCGNSLIQ